MIGRFTSSVQVVALDYQIAIPRVSAGTETRLSVSQGRQTWRYSLHVGQAGLLDADVYVKALLL